MKKGILVSGLIALCLGVTSLSAGDYNLKINMMKLNSELNNLQRGFITGDSQAVAIYLDTFAKSADTLLSNRENMIDMLPSDMKNKKHKVNVAVDAARKIERNVKIIKEALTNKNESERKGHIKTQEAYLKIVNACFKCHNLVRDKASLR